MGYDTRLRCRDKGMNLYMLCVEKTHKKKALSNTFIVNNNMLQPPHVTI